jgi:hypothetical protein
MHSGHATRRIRTTTLCFAAVIVLLALPAQAALEETRTFSTDHFTLTNQIGEVRVEGHSGSQFEVVVQIQGADAREGMIRLEAGDDALEIVFPEDQDDFVYPALGTSGIRLKQSGRSHRSMRSERHGQNMNVNASGSGLELWVDVVVRVPTGATLEVEHGAGKIVARDVEATLELQTRSGDVDIERTDGELSIATGSGDVTVDQARGQEIQIATGSGDVHADDVDADEIQVATGSGDVELETVRGRSMSLATGSGDVQAKRVESDGVSVGTGSGTVELELDRMGNGEYNVGTGSGRIVLTMPRGVSADVHAETDNGRIAVELDDQVEFRQQDEDEVRLSIGGGGARVKLGTGGGDIRIQN